jgi:hypothetical protein
MPNYQAGKDALLGEPGGDAAITGARHTPLPSPGWPCPGSQRPVPCPPRTPRHSDAYGTFRAADYLNV